MTPMDEATGDDERPRPWSRPEVTVPELDLVLADPWKRILARLIDTMLLGTVILLLGYAGAYGDLEGNGSIAVYIVAATTMGAVYEIGFVGIRGATPGKLALRLRVANRDTGAVPPGWDKAALRWVPALATLLPFGIGNLASLAITVGSLIWLFTDDRRRSVYDRVAGTYVVQA